VTGSLNPRRLSTTAQRSTSNHDKDGHQLPFAVAGEDGED
jgi:hypothetical protein